MKKILVLGGNGLVGSELTRQLSEKAEFEVISLSRLPIFQKKLPNVEFALNDDLFAGKINLSDIDIVVICAFSRSNLCEDLSSGLAFTNKLIWYLKENSSASIINISTQGLYGQPRIPKMLNEGDEVCPKDCYGVAKQAVEYLMTSLFEFDRPYTNIRLSSVNFKQRFTQYFVNASLNQTQINAYGKKQQTSLIDVYDVAKGILSVIQMPSEKWKKIYNLGTGKSNSVDEVAKAVNKVAKQVFNINPVKIKYVDREIIPFSPMDISRINKDTGWKPEITLEKMIENMFKATMKELN